MIYVKEQDGEYYLASEQWSRFYEEGAISGKAPAAGFRELADAAAFVAMKNGVSVFPSQGSTPHIHRQTESSPAYPCQRDCRYYNGSSNEAKCDFCIRKGNIFDFYEPCKDRIRMP